MQLSARAIIAMRDYTTTDERMYREIQVSGFQDWYKNWDTGEDGIWFFETPQGEKTGWSGGIVLAMEIPDDVFKTFEVHDHDHWREALIPAAVLNGLGKPELHSDSRTARRPADLGDSPTD